MKLWEQWKGKYEEAVHERDNEIAKVRDLERKIQELEESARSSAVEQTNLGSSVAETKAMLRSIQMGLASMLEEISKRLPPG